MIRNDILSLLEGFTLDNPEEICKDIARDFRRRRIEKDISQKQMAAKSGVSLASLRLFERTGQISLKSLVALAVAMGYATELKTLFGEPKFSTTDELLQINRNRDKQRARPDSKSSTK